MPGGNFRAANALVSGGGGNENTMAPFLTSGLNSLLPRGVEAVFDATRQSSGDRPDLTLRRGQAAIGYVEVKLPSTLGDAFKLNSAGTYQIEKYRTDGLPVLLTDGLRWYDVSNERAWNPDTFAERVNRPYANFKDPADDEQSELSLKTLLSAALDVKPRYSTQSAPLAMQSIIARINDAHNAQLDSAWEAAKGFLRTKTDPEDLGDGKVGELIAFMLLAIAASLDPLPDKTFVKSARAEWNEDRYAWQSGKLPSTLRSALNDFRQVDGETGDAILGSVGWTTIRSVASSIRKSGKIDWDLLSGLWDNYLGIAGQRARLGSWQTPPGVAKYQVQQASTALQTLGYYGFSDPMVTAIDPCCGTGVYMQEVIDQVEREGGTAAGLSGSDTAHARLIGTDISPTAVAATHIRVSSRGVKANLYMADTLGASPEVGQSTGRAEDSAALFGVDDFGYEAALVQAVKRDHRQLLAWAGRDANRDPLVAIVGNPPYQRRGLKVANYTDRAWHKEVYDEWRKGSGGGGVLNDPFVGFLAWAFRVCQIPHKSLKASAPFGVVSFITNRSWVDGKAYITFREWLRKNATEVQISDFGAGSRGMSGGQWSEQPFEIVTGTAILTVTFGASSGTTANVSYQKVKWEDREVVPIDAVASIAGNTNWTGAASAKTLFEPKVTTAGVQTSNNDKWVHVEGDRDFGTRHAFAALDNRYSPTVAPPKAKRGQTPRPNEASASAEWRLDKLFTPHKNPTTRPDWYLVGQQAATRPGPALQATKHLPDKNFYNRRAGKVLPIRNATPVPADYADVVDRLGLAPGEFWPLTLAVSNHRDYWTPGTELSDQLANQSVEPPYPADAKNLARLLEIGTELVDLWSLDTVVPVSFSGSAGAWKFDGHNDAEEIRFHGRDVLAEWRSGRSGDWTRQTATEYARTVAALLKISALSDEVKELLDS